MGMPRALRVTNWWVRKGSMPGLESLKASKSGSMTLRSGSGVATRRRCTSPQKSSWVVLSEPDVLSAPVVVSAAVASRPSASDSAAAADERIIGGSPIRQCAAV